MGICTCGKTLRGSSTKCRRCTALQELGLNAGASAGSIKSAYRLLIKKWHPDVQGKSKARQLAAEERIKRLNIAYNLLTAPSKKKEASPTPRSPAAPEPLRPRSPSPTSTSASEKSARTTKFPQSSDDKQQPRTPGATSTKHPRRSPRAIPENPQRDFTSWKSAFDKEHVNGTKAAAGLKKWISHEAARRASVIAYAVSSCKRLGIEPALENFAMPEDAHADVLKRLWGGSVPNVTDRTNAAKSDKQLLGRMETMRKSVETFANGIKKRKLVTQDGGFIVSLNGVYERCIHLLTSIAEVSTLVMREYVQPFKLADCCIELVWDLEENRGLSQAECHQLIKWALLAHGCTAEDVAPFDEGSVDRGTIRAKKEALAKKLLDGVNIMAQAMQNRKRQNVRSDLTLKKSPL